MTNLVGSDFDGVLAVNHLDRANYSPFKMHQYYAKCVLGPLCRAHMDYIITGRKECFRKVTEKWLHEHNVHYGQLIMLPIGAKEPNKTLLEYKVKKIVDLGINVFFEDDIRIAEFLKGILLNPSIAVSKSLLTASPCFLHCHRP